MAWQVQLAELQSKLGAANVEAQHFPGLEYEKAMAISSTKTGGIAPFFKHIGIFGGYRSLCSLHIDLT